MTTTTKRPDWEISAEAEYDNVIQDILDKPISERTFKVSPENKLRTT